MQNLQEYTCRKENTTCTRSASPAHSKISGEMRHLELPLFSQAHQMRRQLWHWWDTTWTCAGQAPALGTFCKKASTVSKAIFILLGKRAARQQKEARLPWGAPKGAPLISARQWPWHTGHTDEVLPSSALSDLCRLSRYWNVSLLHCNAAHVLLQTLTSQGKITKNTFSGLRSSEDTQGSARSTSCHMASGSGNTSRSNFI